MSRVDSNYARKERDLYETPDWVTLALIPHLPAGSGHRIWEPACGNGAIVRVLADSGFHVYASDIVDGENFFLAGPVGSEGIITNPPYTKVDQFTERAIDLMKPDGFVALLLAADFDSAKSRRHLFADCPIFSKTVVLTKRITWFERTDGKRAAPSENHRWFIWDWKHRGPPITKYAP